MRNVWVGGVLLIALLGWELGSPYMFSEQFNIVIVERVASRSCNEGFVRSIGRSRSEPSKSNIFGYCGAVMTDHGAFGIVESGSFLIGADNREEIFDVLQSGCTLTVQATGFGKKPSLGDIATTGARWTILSADKFPRCP